MVGTFTKQGTSVIMERTKYGNYECRIQLGYTGQEDFQILKNGNYLCALHPKENGATMFDASGEMVLDELGDGLFWSVGVHPDDPVGKGHFAKVHLVMEGGRPKHVWWEHYQCDDSHRLYLAQ